MLRKNRYTLVVHLQNEKNILQITVLIEVGKERCFSQSQETRLEQKKIEFTLS